MENLQEGTLPIRTWLDSIPLSRSDLALTNLPLLFSLVKVNEITESR